MWPVSLLSCNNCHWSQRSWNLLLFPLTISLRVFLANQFIYAFSKSIFFGLDLDWNSNHLLRLLTDRVKKDQVSTIIAKLSY